MKNFRLALFLALVIATTVNSAFAGQIPIGARPGSETDKTTATVITLTEEPNGEISEELSGHLWAFINIVRHLKF